LKRPRRADGFFAFPVHGPFGNDARQNGTAAEIVRQRRFYHEHQNLYLDADLLGFESLETSQSALSVGLDCHRHQERAGKGEEAGVIASIRG
jgi:hypothetical protein